ncbi:MAG: hypothetical protein ACKV22_20570 [Bryobacteraceae bacterium]
MAASAPAEFPHPDPAEEPLRAGQILDVIEKALHPNPAEWIFLRELRVGTGRRGQSLQRLDAFALNQYPHLGMKRVCYEIKASRADFLNELKHPLKRRIGMRYSNEFYFVTPGGMLEVREVPAECGLIEVGRATPEEWRALVRRQAGFFHFDPDARTYCMLTVPSPWRDTPGPTWQLVAAMLRNQRKEFSEKAPALPAQERLAFE